MLRFGRITRDTIEAARKKERDENVPTSLPFHVGTDQSPTTVESFLSCLKIWEWLPRHVSWILLSLQGSRF